MSISFAVKKAAILINRCTGGTGFVRSNYVDSGGWPALFDGIIGTTNETNWVSGSADQQWAGYTFPQAVDVVKLRMNPGNHDSNWNRCPTTFTLRAANTTPSDFANDGALIHSVTGITWAQNEWKEWTFTNGTSYLIYWIYMTDKTDPFGKAGEYIIGEIEMHG